MPKYKHGKNTEPIEFSTFKEVMESKRFINPLHDRSFLSFLYWFGTRKSEAYERVKEDFTLTDTLLVVHCPAKKGGKRETLQAPIDLPYIDLIIQQMEDTKKTRSNPEGRVWNINGLKAWRIIKRSLGEKYYPHFLRLNRAVHFLDDPTTTIPEMQSWFGWRKISTIDSYLGYSKRHLDKQSSRLKNEVV